MDTPSTVAQGNAVAWDEAGSDRHRESAASGPTRGRERSCSHPGEHAVDRANTNDGTPVGTLCVENGCSLPRSAAKRHPDRTSPPKTGGVTADCSGTGIQAVASDHVRKAPPGSGPRGRPICVAGAPRGFLHQLRAGRNVRTAWHPSYLALKTQRTRDECRSTRSPSGAARGRPRIACGRSARRSWRSDAGTAPADGGDFSRHTCYPRRERRAVPSANSNRR